MHRRTLLLQILGFSGASLAVPLSVATARTAPSTPLPPLRLPLPLPVDGLDAATQRQVYARTVVDDRLTVPAGFGTDVLAVWGDPLADGRFGMNNDFLAFFPQPDDTALLTVNFEYISFRNWREGLKEVVPNAPDVHQLIQSLADRDGRIDASTLAAADPLRALVVAVAATAMADLGIGVSTLRKDSAGRWRREPGPRDRRLTGLSGLTDPGQLLRCSGPAAAVFRRPQRLGYNDGLGDRVVGTFANCAGGQTPWGTLLSAEENVQDHVVEAVYADGSSPPPSERPFRCDGERLSGLGNPFALAGNKYGWIVRAGDHPVSGGATPRGGERHPPRRGHGDPDPPAGGPRRRQLPAIAHGAVGLQLALRGSRPRPAAGNRGHPQAGWGAAAAGLKDGGP